MKLLRKVPVGCAPLSPPYEPTEPLFIVSDTVLNVKAEFQKSKQFLFFENLRNASGLSTIAWALSQ
jgi:hypothetical protein